jgi:hypothetical protein
MSAPSSASFVRPWASCWRRRSSESACLAA